MRAWLTSAAAVIVAGFLGLAAVGPATPVADAASPSLSSANVFQGFLTAVPASLTPPTTLTIQTPHRGLLTVQVSATTQIVRRFGGASGLDELSVNDVLQVRGALVGAQTVAATHIRDISIQRSFTHLVGEVLAVTPNSVSVVVQQHRGRAPFAIGEHLTLPVGASTAVISGTTVTMGSTSAISVGMRISALGIFNRASHSFISTFRIHVLAAPRPVVGAITLQGFLTAVPASLTAPTTLAIQTPNRGVVTVQVSATTLFVRRFNGASGLDELSVNDVLQVIGTPVNATTVAATRVRDISIQDAFTHLVGQVLAVTPNSVTVLVQQDRRGRAPFVIGEKLTLPVGASTRVTSGTSVTMGSTSAISVGMRISALGIFNRTSHSFISTFRIHVVPASF